MGRHLLILGLTFSGLAGCALFSGWAFFATTERSEVGARSLGPIWPYLLGGLALAAVLAGVLMWLAFYSARHGYDERVEPDGPTDHFEGDGFSGWSDARGSSARAPR
ncbi:hypothetical protein [Phenylobacterium deserti]|uniref:Uncharacterized protein n=1 Tax=Phenylobacterium deserti TaxID=1914756 RepID=A0A328AXL6_9CAUL|nr:hypothetical protein [Phenylobacterium deserti]RAK57588.1 hypothetical protein DJ018_06570 [Phenylobacterium deserti]